VRVERYRGGIGSGGGGGGVGVVVVVVVAAAMMGGRGGRLMWLVDEGGAGRGNRTFLNFSSHSFLILASSDRGAWQLWCCC
jgi:hypothetical protein